MNVFAKIFSQIFDSSISSDYMVRHVFMDLLVLADRDGVVDMTVDAISRRTNVPEDIVLHALQKLMEPDKASRSKQEDGCRIVLLDSHRDWGWQIVNYDHYRHIRDEESRRAYFRDKKREYRAKSTHVHGGHESPHLSTPVLDSPTVSTEGEGDLEVEREKNKNTSPSRAQIETVYQLYPKHIGKAAAEKAIAKAIKLKTFDALLLAVERYRKKIARDGTDPQFIPHPASWFNQGRYEDEEFQPDYAVKQNGGFNGKSIGDNNVEVARRLIERIGKNNAGSDANGDLSPSGDGREDAGTLFLTPRDRTL